MASGEYPHLIDVGPAVLPGEGEGEASVEGEAIVEGDGGNGGTHGTEGEVGGGVSEGEGEAVAPQPVKFLGCGSSEEGGASWIGDGMAVVLALGILLKRPGHRRYDTFLGAFAKWTQRRNAT